MATHIYEFINADSVGGGGGTYTQSFNGTSDWGAASGGEYTITVSKATHDKSLAPHVQVFELVGGVFELVEVDVEVSAAGNVTIGVPDNIDTRFPGRIVIR